MADIFISYSKSDRELVARLAAMLEAEGWSVWWDKNLRPADTYRDKIMQELANARVVISLWSENSIQSDWVRAEAGRAKADGKLIPIKVSTLHYKDVPLPFGEMHIEPIENADVLRTVVRSQLDKPIASPKVHAQIFSLIKYNVLTWLGLLGGMLTLLSSLSMVLQLAEWAKFFVSHWVQFVRLAWHPIFSALHMEISGFWGPLLSFATFCIPLTIGLAISEASNHSIRDERPAKSHPVRALVCLVLIFVAPFAFLLGLFWCCASESAPVYVATLPFVVGYLAVPTLISIAAVGVSAYGILSVLSILVFILVLWLPPTFAAGVFGLGQIDVFSDRPFMFISQMWIASNVALLWPMALAVILLNPLKALCRRLVFLTVGLAALLGLSKLSQMSSDLFRPVVF